MCPCDTDDVPAYISYQVIYSKQDSKYIKKKSMSKKVFNRLVMFSENGPHIKRFDEICNEWKVTGN